MAAEEGGMMPDAAVEMGYSRQRIINDLGGHQDTVVLRSLDGKVVFCPYSGVY